MRGWANPAHYRTPLWRIALLGAALGLGAGGIGELLLRASS